MFALRPHVVEREEPVRGLRWRYGYGLYFLVDDAGRVIRYGLPGEEEGVSCRLFHYPRLGIDLTILGNQSGCALQLGWQIHDLTPAHDGVDTGQANRLLWRGGVRTVAA